MTNAIEVRDLTKIYPDFTLDSVSFSVPEGTVFGLAGENGAGKSTTLKLILNSFPRDGGTVLVLGQDNRDKGFTDLKNDLGVVFDEAYFPEMLSAKDVGKIMKRTYKNWDEEAFSAYLRRFSLPTNKKFKEFSRGMKMKLAISVALSHHPKLLILDEATGGLDPVVRDEILDIFNEFTRNEHHSILMSSHIVSDLEKICDYFGFIHNGKMILCDEKDKILSDYVLTLTTREIAAKLPCSSVLGKKETPYGVKLLMKKNDVPEDLETEKATLEDVIVFLAKEGRA